MSFQNEVWLAIRNDGDGIGSGTPSDPYAVNTPATFAAKMNSLPENTLICLLPGIFRTRGTAGAVFLYEASRQRASNSR